MGGLSSGTQTPGPRIPETRIDQELEAIDEGPLNGPIDAAANGAIGLEPRYDSIVGSDFKNDSNHFAESILNPNLNPDLDSSPSLIRYVPSTIKIPVAVAFDYMRVKVRDIEHMELFTPALLKLYEISGEGNAAEVDGINNVRKRKEK
jgi:hypothetical protein